MIDTLDTYKGIHNVRYELSEPFEFIYGRSINNYS